MEGRAASDEEEDKWSGEQQRQMGEVKRILSRLSCCGERYAPPLVPRVPHAALAIRGSGAPPCHLCLRLRCDNKAFKQLMSTFGSLRSEESCSAVVQLLERVTRLQKELELRERREGLDAEQVRAGPACAAQGGLRRWERVQRASKAAPGAAEPPCVCLQLLLAGPDHRNTPPWPPRHRNRN